MNVLAPISSIVASLRKAARMTSKRSDAGRSSIVSRSARSSASRRGGASSSRERMAFRNAWAKVRPMAIASPTDFMCVESSALAPLNFSKAKRGHLTTT